MAKKSQAVRPTFTLNKRQAYAGQVGDRADVPLHEYQFVADDNEKFFGGPASGALTMKGVLDPRFVEGERYELDFRPVVAAAKKAAAKSAGKPAAPKKAAKRR